MTNENENKYIDLSKENLDIFIGYNNRFPERLADYFFHDMLIAVHRGEISQEEYENAETSENPYPENPYFSFSRGNNYVPNIDAAKKWASGVLKNRLPNTVSEQNFQEYIRIQRRILNMVLSREIDGEEARAIAAREFGVIEERESAHKVLDQDPTSEEWSASQINAGFNTLNDNRIFLEKYFISGFDLSKYFQHYSDDPFVVPFANLDEVLEEIRFQYNETMQTAFKVGFLYHDAWWKARHEEAARKHYEMLDKNKKNGKKGGHADKKRNRYIVLDRLARENINKFIHVSDKEAARIAKALADNYDRKATDKLFQNRGKGLSLEWYSEWLTCFRRSARKINTL